MDFKKKAQQLFVYSAQFGFLSFLVCITNGLPCSTFHGKKVTFWCLEIRACFLYHRRFSTYFDRKYFCIFIMMLVVVFLQYPRREKVHDLFVVSRFRCHNAPRQNFPLE